MLSTKFKFVLEQLLFASNCFVLILVLGESYLLIPDWLHVFGRLHPLLLHFPIVVLLMAALILGFPRLIKDNSYHYGSNLLLLGSLMASFTVIAGLLLSNEEGYEKDVLFLHKWTGLIVFWLASFVYFFLKNSKSLLQKAGVGLMSVFVFLSGHFGAAITHGEGFITAPLAKDKELEINLEEAEVFAHLVMPALEQKCVSCHKASKQKGGLRMDKPEFIFTGGESGPAVTAGDVENSLLVSRIHLPVENDEHMPPKGKPQLSEEEKEILEEWVRTGAETETKILALDQSAPLYSIGATKFSESTKGYTFPAAEEGKVKELNSFYRKVQRLGADSPALSVSYFGSSVFDAASLAELLQIETQLVSLNLNNMPLADGDLQQLHSFVNLEKLHLNFTGISGEGLQYLTGLGKLKRLSVSGNPLESQYLENLSKLEGLEQLFIWNAGLSMDDIKKLKDLLPNTRIELGHKE